MFFNKIIKKFKDSFDLKTKILSKIPLLSDDDLLNIEKIKIKSLDDEDWQIGKPSVDDVSERIGFPTIGIKILKTIFVLLCIFFIYNFTIAILHSYDAVISEITGFFFLLILSFVIYFFIIGSNIYLKSSSIVFERIFIQKQSPFINTKYIEIPYNKFKEIYITSNVERNDHGSTTTYSYSITFAGKNDGEYIRYWSDYSSNSYSNVKKVVDLIKQFANPYKKKDYLDKYLDYLTGDVFDFVTNYNIYKTLKNDGIICTLKSLSDKTQTIYEGKNDNYMGRGTVFVQNYKKLNMGELRNAHMVKHDIIDVSKLNQNI